MKIEINKSAKRVLSVALALAMVIGTLFTANVGTNIIANAQTAPIAEGTIDLLEFSDDLVANGSSSKYYDTNVADNGETGADWDNAIIIDSAEELVYLCKGSGNETKGKYYKVADGLAGFNLSNKNLDIDGTLADNLNTIQAAGKNHAGNTPGFQGYFDGNGATVYGAWCSHTSVSAYTGLFSCTYGNVIIKNINVNKASFTATTAAGGIVGYHRADDAKSSLVIENCSVTDSHIETTGTGYGVGVGAFIGYGASAPSWKEADKGVDGNGDGDKVDTIYENVPYIIKNCYVNLDEQYFISAAEDGTVSSGERACHGGVVGVSGSNALAVSDCIVIGIKPYATSENTAQNDVQHSALESHFTNVYTTADVPITNVFIGGTLTRNFTGRIIPLTDAQLKGSAAVSNMNLAWFSAWTPGAEGEYPTLNQTATDASVSFWSGASASGFAGGTGKKDDPFIIETADQLYYALTNITYTTSTSGDLAVETAESVAGGTQTSRMLKQSSTTVYVPVYTPYYYKVADGVKAFYLNNVYGNETLAGAKAMGASATKKDWKPGKSFVGYLDGNGVTIYGMYSSTGQGLVYKLDGASTVKNFNFDACYATGSGNSALVTTNLGGYTNDSTIINVANISVRDSYIATTRNITLTARTDGSGCYDHNPGPAGIISTGSTPESITVSNCFYDGDTCERAIGSGSEATVDMMGAIYSGTSSANNFIISGCISFGASPTNEVYVAGKEAFYNRYDKNQGFPVFFYNCYTDYPATLANKYSGKYDKLLDIDRIEAKDAYEMYDLPKLSWGEWELVTDGDRVIPMPTVNNSVSSIGSYIDIVGKGQNTYAGTGPYAYGANPYTYLLKGSGTEEDPYLIETDVQLARAIATGGMNLYDKLYYKLANDIDISAGAWINQSARSEGGIYYKYTPFGGVLDGDGHTVTGLSAGDSASAGLIPVLEGGTVKNLHLRDVAVVSGEYAGALVGWMYGGSVTNCSVENAIISSAGGSGESPYIVYNDDLYNLDEYGTITNCYYVGKDEDGNDTAIYITDHNADDGIVRLTADEIKEQIISGETDEWYIGGKEGSIPRLVSQAEKMYYADVDGDGIANEYTPNDLTSLKNKLLRKSAYKNIYGDVSRDGKINVADLAVLQRTIVEEYGEAISDSFFANVKADKIKIYYGENDNYDAARKVELYLESVTGADVIKVVSSSKGTVTGANSDGAKVYLHANDEVGTPDGELEIIVGNIDNYNAYKTNTVATGANTYAVTYDEENKVVWLQGENFTAVEQAAINFTNGSFVNGDVVYTCGSTVLEACKQPVTVTLDTDFDGSITDTKDGGATVTTLYYAWGDEFEEDTINTNNWQHNTQQTEAMNGSDGSYNNLEIAPIKDLNKVITVTNGRLSMKRGHDSSLGGDVSYNGVVGSVALDVEPGEFNGYNVWSDAINGYVPAIDTDGSDKYFGSGKVTTERGMLYKQGYIEFQGQLPADGHAFPAWWLMGRSAQTQTNAGYDNSLYGKVYKLNDKWNGANEWDKSNLDTYKYQIPSAIYEIDMIEVMQHSDRHYLKKESSWLGTGASYYGDYYKGGTAVNLYYLNSTIHKWWNNAATDTELRIVDWDNYTISSPITNANFKTTSSDGSWIHNIGSTTYDFGTPTVQQGSFLKATYWNTVNHNEAAHNKLTQTRRYGFSWNTNGTGFEATLYIYNADGNGNTVTVPIASGMSDYAAFKDKDKNSEANGAIGSVDGGAYKNVYNDAKVFNQYMYILFDNKYYSSNENTVTNGSALQFSDLLTCAGLKSLEIDYVRVYQEDGYRDIVTQATENFNNNNHFGYN